MNLNKLIKVADWYLYRENLIRQQVREARAKRRQFTIHAWRHHEQSNGEHSYQAFDGDRQHRMEERQGCYIFQRGG